MTIGRPLGALSGVQVFAHVLGLVAVVVVGCSRTNRTALALVFSSDLIDTSRHPPDKGSAHKPGTFQQIPIERI
jgi:hypothetical protein